MTKTVELEHSVLDRDIHRTLKYNADFDYKSLQNEQVLPILISEFTHVASENPIVFVKDSNTGEFKAVALYGLESNQNLSITSKGWDGLYVPRAIKNKHFKLAKLQHDDSQLQLTFNHTSPQFSQTDGIPLFDENGADSEFLIYLKQELSSYLQHYNITAQLIATISELDLLIARKLTVNMHNKTFNVEGVYVVDEQRLNRLASDHLDKLRQADFLLPVYAHILSLNQALRLASKACELSD